MNSGLIRGPTQPYNDVPVWEWQLALRFMGAKEGQYKSYSIETAGQLEELLADETFNAANVIQLVEVHMDQMDAPRALRLQAALVSNLLAGMARLTTSVGRKGQHQRGVIGARADRPSCKSVQYQSLG